MEITTAQLFAIVGTLYAENQLLKDQVSRLAQEKAILMQTVAALKAKTGELEA